MFASDFAIKLRKLNPRLRIFAGNDDSKPAGLWIMWDGEVRELCGVDKNYLNEWPTYNLHGKMIRGGWNRIIKMLVSTKLVDRHTSYKHFGHWDEHREPPQQFLLEKIDQAIADLKPVGMKQIVSPLDGSIVETPIYNRDEVVDIGRMIAKQDKRPSPPPSGNGLNLEV